MNETNQRVIMKKTQRLSEKNKQKSLSCCFFSFSDYSVLLHNEYEPKGVFEKILAPPLIINDDDVIETRVIVLFSEHELLLTRMDERWGVFECE